MDVALLLLDGLYAFVVVAAAFEVLADDRPDRRVPVNRVQCVSHYP